MRLPLLRSPQVVFGLLVAATILTTWVLSKDAFDSRGMVVAVLAIAGWKVRLVLLDFMELRDAPWYGRAIFEGWIAAVVVVLAGVYLAG